MTCVKLAPHPTQNVAKIVSIVCAPFVLVCAVKKNVCAALFFLDIKIIFIGHSEVTQPPHIVQIHPK